MGAASKKGPLLLLPSLPGRGGGDWYCYIVGNCYNFKFKFIEYLGTSS